MAPRNHRRRSSKSGAGRHAHAAGSSSGPRNTEIPPADGNIISTRVGGNIYQYKGSGKGFEVKAVKEGLYLVIVMPGVDDNGADVWMEEHELFFSGESKKEAEFEENRVYGGCIDLGSDSGNISDMKVDMKNGVLRIILVGCTIQPEVSLDVPLPSYAQPSDPSELEWFKFKDGKRMIGLRRSFILDPPDESFGIYPFQLSGPQGSTESTILGPDHMYLRMDMPDVPSNKKIVEFRNDTLYFGGEGEKWSEYDENGVRGYFGTHNLLCGCCNYVSIESAIKNGVLRMLAEKKKIPGRKAFCACKE